MGISCPDVEGFRRMCDEYARYDVIWSAFGEDMRKRYIERDREYGRMKKELDSSLDEFVERMAKKNATYWPREDSEAKDKYVKATREKWKVCHDRECRCSRILGWFGSVYVPDNALDDLKKISHFEYIYDVNEEIVNIGSRALSAFAELLVKLRKEYPQWTNISFDDAWVDRDENITVPLKNQEWFNVSVVGFREIYKKLFLEREVAKLNEETRSIQRSREEYLALVNQGILDDEKALEARAQQEIEEKLTADESSNFELFCSNRLSNYNSIAYSHFYEQWKREVYQNINVG
jgi:uncharacterized protein YfkK (UPF0435 family)